jgi:hypothetical protein
VEASNVAKIQPTSKDDRQAYRETLSGEQRRAFDELGNLIDSARDDLAWHHRVGELVGQLRPKVQRGTEWVHNLGKALGPSAALLAKARRFAQLYPTQKAVRELEAMRANWTRLYISFAVSDQEKRHALLDRAVNKRWSNQRLRFTVQERSRSKRGGVGGRPRRPVASHGPEVTLRELERQCRRWLDFHEQAWRGVKDRDWVRFVRSWPKEDIDDLLQLLGSAEEAVQGVARASQAVRTDLKRLRKRAERRQGLYSHK